MQDPELYLQELGIKMPCVVSSERSAVIDSAHRSFIGYETYFFSDDAAKARFDRSPERYCGPLTDPISLRHFHPKEDSPRLTHENRLYIFATDSTRDVFAMMPGMYQYPEHKMIPADSAKETH